jgi:AAA domain
MSPLINPFTQNNTHPNQAVITPAKASKFFSPIAHEGGALGLYGDCGTGKTLTLNYITNPPADWQEAHFNQHIFLFINCQDTVIPPTPNNFWIQLTKTLNRKLEDGAIKQKCHALLARVAEALILDHNDFHEILDVAAGAKKRIILVLDDFDCMIRTDPENFDTTRSFLQGFRSLTTRDSNKANLVTATRYSLQELCKPFATPYYSAFDNGFTNHRLRYLSESELLQLLRRIDQTDQPSFSATETRYIAYLSGCHPKLAQLAAAEIFDQRLDSHAPLNENDLMTVGDRFKSESRPVFESFWAGASEVERVFLMLIALQKLQGKVTNAQYDLSGLTDLFSQHERELNELTQRSLLNRTQASPPRWEIFSPIFEWWILKEIESTPPDQLDDRRKIWGNLVTQKRADQLGDIVEFLKRNRESIESFGRFILRLLSNDPPQLPGA